MTTKPIDDFRRLRREGDPRLRDELVERFVPLAHALAARYARGRDSDEDLQQVACVGLLKAVDRFDPERGNSFQTFATPTILGELRRHFRNTSWGIHVSRSIQERALAIRAAADQLVGELRRSPTPAELAERMGATVEEVLEALEQASAASTESLDVPAQPGDDQDGFQQYEVVGALDPGFELVEDQAAVEPALRDLPHEERMVLGLRYFGDMSQAEIARRIGVSQMYVSRLLRRTLAEVRSEALPGAA